MIFVFLKLMNVIFVKETYLLCLLFFIMLHAFLDCMHMSCV